MCVCVWGGGVSKNEDILFDVTFFSISAEEDLGDTSNLSAEERNQLFARGLSREKAGKKDAALKCYLGCLSGLSRHTRFVLLPQCLRNVSTKHTRFVLLPQCLRNVSTVQAHPLCSAVSVSEKCEYCPSTPALFCCLSV